MEGILLVGLIVFIVVGVVVTEVVSKSAKSVNAGK